MSWLVLSCRNSSKHGSTCFKVTFFVFAFSVGQTLTHKELGEFKSDFVILYFCPKSFDFKKRKNVLKQTLLTHPMHGVIC